MPAEWEFQAATWFSWPHNLATWPHNLAQAQREFVDLIRCVAKYQRVFILAGNSERKNASELVGDNDNVSLIDIATNDAWARDYAPTFVHDQAGNLVVMDWHYNAWGGKYPPFDLDQQVSTKIAEHLGVDHQPVDLCIEGGAIEVNQSEALLTTRSCALNPNRNPGKTLAEIETTLCDSLGKRHCIWLTGDALDGDDTDGHIDQLARFVDEHTIVYAWTESRFDPQRTGLEQNLNDLKTGLAIAGLSDIRLVPLNIPQAIEIFGQRIPASYCNFLMANGLVVVPQFGVPQDDTALKTLESFFPDRSVIGLPSIHLSYGQGSFHCLSQQQPKTGGSPIE